jgi:TonB family protein
LFACVIQPQSASTEYDPDAQQATLAVEVEEILADNATTLFGVLLSRRLNANSKSVGENAFGVRRTINSRSYVEHWLVMGTERVGNGRSGRWSQSFNIRISIDSARARKVVPSMRALAIFRLSPPFVSTLASKVTQRPTLEMPTEIARQRNFIHADLEGIWWYSAADGEVVYRFGGGDAAGPREVGDELVAPVRPREDARIEVVTPMAPLSAVPVLGPTSPNVVRLGSPPLKLHDVRPVYPSTALSARVQGNVVVQLQVGADGEVREARIVRSIPLLDEAALEAVRQWKFRPTFVGGVPTPVVFQVSVGFVLVDGC